MPNTLLHTTPTIKLSGQQVISIKNKDDEKANSLSKKV